MASYKDAIVPGGVPAQKRKGAKKMIYIGVDPGATGAIAAVNVDEDVLIADFNPGEVLRFLEGVVLEDVCRAVIEKVGSMPKQGVSSTFKFGANYGWWQGVFYCLKIPYELITPQRWQKEIFDSATKGKDRKQMSLEMARRLFPRQTHMLVRKKDNGRADALLIAEYCRRIWTRR